MGSCGCSVVICKRWAFEAPQHFLLYARRLMRFKRYRTRRARKDALHQCTRFTSEAQRGDASNGRARARNALEANIICRWLQRLPGLYSSAHEYANRPFSECYGTVAV